MTKRNYPDNVTCHLCGLPIPNHVVNYQDRLFGTIDHVVPRAIGGIDSPDNRKPAHRMCNNRKGKKPLTPELQAECKLWALYEFSERPHMMPRVRKLQALIRKEIRKAVVGVMVMRAAA